MSPKHTVSLFEPPVDRWERLSPKYLVVKLIGILIWWPILTGGAFAFVWFVTPDDWSGRRALLTTIVVAGVLMLAWRAIRAPFAVRRWGYAERDEDVYLTRGLLSRQLTCVPYGRMQLVEVNSGPVERLFGLATVSMVTASSSGAVSIPGLDVADAEAVRDRFINRGKHLRAGI
ncbi:MAG: PH domain-containing protein [Propionibacterium sp.]|nr:PH domain-containing protein [Propionibacterium sp.]